MRKILVSNQNDIDLISNLEVEKYVKLSNDFYIFLSKDNSYYFYNGKEWELVELDIQKKCDEEQENNNKKKKDNISNIHDNAKFESIEFDNVSFTYHKNEKPSLDQVSFKINKGEFHAFIGENGAGKSTTIKIIIGENREYDGVVKINNINIKNNVNAKQKLSYLNAENKFPRYLSVFKYLYNIGLMHYNDVDLLKNDIESFLEKFSIAECRNKKIQSLSLGQQKKIQLIRCLLERAQIIILDEPVANLDPTTKLQIFELLKQIQLAGITIFISTHLIDEIKKYATNLTLISEGKIKYSGDVNSTEFNDITTQFFEERKQNVNSKEIADIIIERGLNE